MHALRDTIRACAEGKVITRMEILNKLKIMESMHISDILYEGQGKERTELEKEPPAVGWENFASENMFVFRRAFSLLGRKDYFESQLDAHQKKTYEEYQKISEELQVTEYEPKRPSFYFIKETNYPKDRRTVLVQQMKLNEIFYTIYLLSQCNNIFSEIALENDYRCCRICEQIFKDIISLVSSNHPVIAYHACRMLCSFTSYDPYNDLKSEAKNKSYLANGDFDLFRNLLQQLARCLYSKEDFLGVRAQWLKVYGILCILHSYLVDKIASTPREILIKVIAQIAQPPIFSAIFTELMYSPLQSISVMATEIVVSVLEQDQPEIRKITRELKRQLLENSTIFLR